jgi:hypothetical protein
MIVPGPFGQALANESSNGAALGRAWAEGKITSDKCKQQASNIGDFIGTSFTARDMFQVVDNIDEDGKLRYWGKFCLRLDELSTC